MRCHHRISAPDQPFFLHQKFMINQFWCGAGTELATSYSQGTIMTGDFGRGSQARTPIWLKCLFFLRLDVKKDRAQPLARHGDLLDLPGIDEKVLRNSRSGEPDISHLFVVIRCPLLKIGYLLNALLLVL